MVETSARRDFIHDLIDARNEHDVYHASVSLAKNVLSADRCQFVSVDEDDLHVLASTDDEFGATPSVPIASDIIGQLDLIGRSHVFDDIEDVRSAAAAQSATIEGYTPRSLLLVPIDEVGLLVATNETAGAFDEADRQWAEQLGTFVSGVMDSGLTYEGEYLDVDRLEQVASILSHDFTGPLSVARGALQLAEETGDAEYFEQARKAITRIEQLVDSVERLARSEDGIGRIELVEIRSIVQEVWPSIDTGTASLEVADSRSILADEQALAQLLMNLFSNAVDHGGDEVTVTVGIMDDGFYVEDDGSGIPEGERSKVFTWGYTSNDGHKGIGLSIVDQICDAHGWDVTITSSAAGGARFEITGIDD